MFGLQPNHPTLLAIRAKVILRCCCECLLISDPVDITPALVQYGHAWMGGAVKNRKE
jgi:hypothetical protein